MSLPRQMRTLPVAYGRPEIPEHVGRELVDSFIRWGEAAGSRPVAARFLTPQIDGWCVEMVFYPGLRLEVTDLDAAGYPGCYTLSARLAPDAEWVEICRTPEEAP